jgi:hypothetical protein
MYEQGQGVAKDPSEAAKWYQKVVEHGEGTVQAMAKKKLEKLGGAAQVPVDDVMAFLEAQAAYKQGNLRYEWKVKHHDLVKDLQDALHSIPPQLFNDPIYSSGPEPKFSSLVYQQKENTSEGLSNIVLQKKVIGAGIGAALIHQSEYSLDDDRGQYGKSVDKTETYVMQILGGLVTAIELTESDTFSEAWAYDPVAGDDGVPPVALPGYNLEKIIRWEGSEGHLFPLQEGNHLKVKYVTASTYYRRERVKGVERRRIEMENEWRHEFTFKATVKHVSDFRLPKVRGGEGSDWIIEVIRKSALIEDGPIKPLLTYKEEKAIETSYAAHFSTELNWVPSLPPELPAPVGYVVEGRNVGASFAELSAPHRAAYLKVREHVKKQYQRAVADARSERAERLAMDEKELTKTTDAFTNWMNLFSGMAGVAVKGLQQMEAAKQGIPPTVNIVPGQAMGEAGAAGDPYDGAAAGGEAYRAGVGLGAPGSAGSGSSGNGGICTDQWREALDRQANAECDPIQVRAEVQVKQLQREKDTNCNNKVGNYKGPKCEMPYSRQIEQVRTQYKADTNACRERVSAPLDQCRTPGTR